MLACAVVVVVDPSAMLQAGFWLSFVAVGVLFATDFGLALPREANGVARKTASRVGAMLREQWVVTVALAPLNLLLFGQVSLVGLLANVVAVPFVTLVITPLAMLATSGVLGGVLLVARLPLYLRCLGLFLLLPVLLWQVPVPPTGEVELLAADIGQGNAVLVCTANHTLLYDAGPRYSMESDAGHRVLLPLLQTLHVKLDMLLFSHRDTDHVGGAVAVLNMHPQAVLMSSIASDDRLRNLRKAQRCIAGQHWEWDSVQFSILHPQAADCETPRPPNALSCVLRIQSAGTPSQTALLVGDIEKPQQEVLVAAQAPFKADVLLVPHHSSKTSSRDEFLSAVQPREAWIQAGYRNRYRHPAPVVAQSHQECGIVVHDSPHCGAMTWRSDSPAATHCLRSDAMHYWSHRVP